LIRIIIIFLSIVDLSLTHKYLKTFKNMFPDKDYTLLEANPIIKLALRKFGFPKGMYVSIPFLFILLIIAICIISTEWLYFAMGLYVMMVIYHFCNLNQLKALKKQIEEQIEKHPDYIKAKDELKESLKKDGAEINNT